MQDRRERRLSEEREVGVPQTSEGVALRLRRLTHDRDDLWVIGDGLDERHRAERPEAPAERDLLFRSQILATEEHDLVVEHRATGLGDHRVVEVVREIDAADDRTARASCRLDGDAPIRVALGGRGNRDEPRRRRAGCGHAGSFARRPGSRA